MENTVPTAFQIGTWHVQPLLRRITRGDRTVALEPKVMEVLAVLARHAGDVVTREQLLETVWPDQVVTEEALTRCVSALRNAFEDDYQNPAFIETIWKTGYCLIAPVSLDAIIAPSRTKSPIVPSPEPPPRRWPWVMLAIISLGLLGTYIWRTPPPSYPSLRIVPFTALVGNEMQPAFSPDGNHVAFAWDSRQGTHLDVYLKSIDSETPLRVTSDSAYEVSPTWAPDGSRLAFARVWDTCEILTVPLLGGPERKLTDCGGWGNPQLDWSPDASTPTMAISESYSRQAPHRIVLLSLETLEKRPLTHPSPQHRGDRRPRFSPDGKTLAFVRTTDQVSDIYLVPVSGGDPTRLTFDNLDIAGLAWVPDGQSIIYASNRTGTYSLWRISVQGGISDLLLASGESIINPALVVRDGLLVYEQWSNETNIYRVPVNATAASDAPPEVLIASTRWDAEPQYAPAGDRIAFVSNRSGSFEIWLSDPDGTNPVQLTAFEGPVTRHPHWSPDGTRLAFDSRVKGNADIYLIEAAGGRPHRLTTAPSIDTHPSWSPDGRWIFFASDRSGTWQVWKMLVEGGEALQVTLHSGFMAQVSPDGASLYYTKHDTSGIWQMPVQGGVESQITPLLLPEYADAWIVTQDGIYFIRPEKGADLKLTFYEAATGHLSDVTDFSVTNRRPGFTVSPDGQWMLYPQLDRSESDLVLVEGLH